LARACAEETSELIKSEIGDRWFAVLVDEARDASIKEQMAVVVRYIPPLHLVISLVLFCCFQVTLFSLFSCRFVNDKGSVIERFLGIEHVSDTTSTSLKKHWILCLEDMVYLFPRLEGKDMMELQI